MMRNGDSIQQATPPTRSGQSQAWVWAVVAVLAGWNVVANTVLPEPLAVPVNLAAAAGLVWIARRAGAGWPQLGLARRDAGRGAVLGAAVAIAIPVAAALAALLPPVREAFADGRFAGVGDGEMLYATLLRIPLATALAEEIAFRGVLFGLLLARTSLLRSVLLSSAAFGLWHILPGLAALDTATVIEGTGSLWAQLGGVAAQVLITGIAGAGFCWLRLRGRHVVAPALAHWGLNGGAFVIGWLIVQNGWS
jgi:membrane protease YdiL (CAAX protease family)